MSFALTDSNHAYVLITTAMVDFDYRLLLLPSTFVLIARTLIIALPALIWFHVAKTMPTGIRFALNRLYIYFDSCCLVVSLNNTKASVHFFEPMNHKIISNQYLFCVSNYLSNYNCTKIKSNLICSELPD